MRAHITHILLLTAAVLSASLLLVSADGDDDGPIVTERMLEMAEYLRQFGYISKDIDFYDFSNAEFIELCTDALKEFQKFHGLPETGEFDVETEDVMQQPRCSNADDDVIQLIEEQQKDNPNLNYEDLVVTKSVWLKSDLPLTFSVYNVPSKIDRAKSIEIIKQAVQDWVEVSGFTAQYVPNGGRLSIDFQTIDSAWNVLGRGWFPRQGKVVLDDMENWSTDDNTPNNRVSLRKVALHEVGHALGINHLDVKSAIMYPSYSGNTLNHLGSDDIRAITELYGPPLTITPVDDEEDEDEATEEIDEDTEETEEVTEETEEVTEETEEVTEETEEVTEETEEVTEETEEVTEETEEVTEETEEDSDDTDESNDSDEDDDTPTRVIPIDEATRRRFIKYWERKLRFFINRIVPGFIPQPQPQPRQQQPIPYPTDIPTRGVIINPRANPRAPIRPVRKLRKNNPPGLARGRRWRRDDDVRAGNRGRAKGRRPRG